MKPRPIIDSYINYIEEKGYAFRTIIRYRYVLDIFRDFFVYVNVQKFDEELLKGIRLDEIFKSLIYYNLRCGPLSEHTARFFFIVIKELIKFSKNNDNLINSFGLSDDDKSSYIYQTEFFVNDLLKKGDLREGKGISPLTDDLIELIVEYCDECANSIYLDRIHQSEEAYNRYVKAIATKLIMYLGLSKQKISEIKYSDLDLTKGTIKIGKYVIHIPHRLRSQLEFYVEKVIYHLNPNDTLLMYANGKSIQNANEIGQFAGNVLRNCDAAERKSATISIAKYAIIQLIDAGIDRDTVYELTGYSATVFDGCKEFIDEVENSFRDKALDQKLKAIPSFDFL